MIKLLGAFAFALLVPLFLSTASCESSSDPCVVGEDETSLLQTQWSVDEKGKGKTNTENKFSKTKRKQTWTKKKHSKSKRKENIEGDVGLGSQKRNDIAAFKRQGPIPDLTTDIDGTNFASVTVDSSVLGIMPILGSRPRRMATVNLAHMALSVPGDFVETGVFAGSSSVLMAKVLQAGGQGRKLWCADSWEGLPNEDPSELAREQDPAEAQKDHMATTFTHRNSDRIGEPGQYSFALDQFEKNMDANGIQTVQILKGWFSDTLPTAPIGSISFLRLDGDMYVSTMDALNNLYDKVTPGGYIYVDDYGSYAGCHHAIDDFRKSHGIMDLMYPILEGTTFDALWWQKSR